MNAPPSTPPPQSWREGAPGWCLLRVFPEQGEPALVRLGHEDGRAESFLLKENVARAIESAKENPIASAAGVGILHAFDSLKEAGKEIGDEPTRWRIATSVTSEVGAPLIVDIAHEDGRVRRFVRRDLVVRALVGFDPVSYLLARACASLFTDLTRTPRPSRSRRGRNRGPGALK